MASRSFRCFADKEDLIEIFNDFQSRYDVFFYKYGRADSVKRMDDITKADLFGINTTGSHIGNLYLAICSEFLCKVGVEKVIFIDQKLNPESVVIDIGGTYENDCLLPTEISTIWYENESSKFLYNALKRTVKRHTAITKNGYCICKNAYLNKNNFRFVTIDVKSPKEYDLKIGHD